MRHRSFHAILALLLVLAQTGLLLHESDIAAHADESDSCEICLVGHGLGHTLSDAGQASSSFSNTDFQATPSAPVFPCVRYGTYSPRAPPSSKFS